VTAAALALAVAALVGGRPLAVRLRAGMRHARSRSTRPAREAAVVHDPLGGASALDLFAVCLSSGMAVSTAARATATSAPPALARILGRAADLLALGADPATAWAPPTDGHADEQCRGLLRLARRAAASGAAFADSVAELAVESRHDAARAADAAAERAGVVIAGPLGVCFLPAFICLGVVPVVAGLAGDVFTSGLL